MIHYIIQTIAFQVFFLLVYDVFLKKETFFNWNRIYLLGTAVLSILIPLIKVDWFKKVLPEAYSVTLPEIIIGELSGTVDSPFLLQPVAVGNRFSVLEIIFYLGIIITLGIFLFKMIKVIKLIFENPKSYKGKLTLVELKQSYTAFSFFNYIFLGELIAPKEKESILKHELTHVTQKHTLDLLFFEVMRVVFWFNPLVYLYQNKIMTLHEFIADAQAVKHQNKADYYQNLLSQIFETNTISFINPFFKQSLIKKRIVMLQKSKSKQVKLFKYALLIPLVLGMLVYTSCGNQKSARAKEKPSLTEQINQLNDVIESKEITLEEEKQAMINLSKTLNKTKYKNTSDVLLFEVDDVPIFPGCEELAKEDRKKCLSQNLAKYVGLNFDTNIASKLGLKGKHRINIMFKINEEGNIVDVRSRAPHPELEKEAIRVIYTIPKLKPGIKNGKAVNVPYSLPILFEIAD